ncbi:MAG: HD domain-containing protein [Desulfarculus sp.]|nr:HD domain-containing protein [Desulfarculus sp.]
MTPARPWPLIAHDPALVALQGLARRQGARVWLTGGTLRDLLLGLAPPDLDLSTDGDALALGRALAQALGRPFVPLKEALATCRVVLEQGHLDLVGLRAPGLEADLRRRDFTVNALAAPLAGVLAGRAAIKDPTGGLADLGARRLRLAGPGVLSDDPLRVLRAYRFLASHGLSLAPGLEQDLAAAAPGLFRVARERIAQEWRKLMAAPAAAPAVWAMERGQVLTRLMPELAMGRGVLQNPFHHLDVLEHNLATLAHLEELAAGGGVYAGSLLLQEASAYLAGQNARAQLKTAALLHDLGKPATRRPKAPGWATFHRHDLVGAGLAGQAARRLGLSKAEAGHIASLVAGHMRPFHLLGAATRGGLSRRAVRRLLVACGQHLPGVFLLGLADTMAGRGPMRPAEAEERLLALYGQVAELRDRELAQALAAPPLLDGHQLMAGLSLEPGPEVGRLLGLLREAQLDGLVDTPQAALALARRLIRPPRLGRR